MKILTFILIFLMFITYAIAENRIYYDATKDIEIVDVSGKKSIEQLQKEFNCSNLVEITRERQIKEAESKVISDKKLKKELMIEKKMRDFVILELIKEGKLDAEGNLKDE